jgi:manganese transport protein
MGEFVNARWLKVIAFTIATVIASLNIWLLIQFFMGG